MVRRHAVLAVVLGLVLTLGTACERAARDLGDTGGGAGDTAGGANGTDGTGATDVAGTADLTEPADADRVDTAGADDAGTPGPDGGEECAPGPENTVAACTDGCSNDGDYYIDCEDYDCCDLVTCPVGTACHEHQVTCGYEPSTGPAAADLHTCTIADGLCLQNADGNFDTCLADKPACQRCLLASTQECFEANGCEDSERALACCLEDGGACADEAGAAAACEADLLTGSPATCTRVPDECFVEIRPDDCFAAVTVSGPDDSPVAGHDFGYASRDGFSLHLVFTRTSPDAASPLDAGYVSVDLRLAPGQMEYDDHVTALSYYRGPMNAWEHYALSGAAVVFTTIDYASRRGLCDGRLVGTFSGSDFLGGESRPYAIAFDLPLNLTEDELIDPDCAPAGTPYTTGVDCCSGFTSWDPSTGETTCA